MRYLLILISLPVLVACNQPEENIKTLRVGYVMATGGTSHEGAEKFKEIVEKNTNIQVKLYPNGVLGPDRVLVESLVANSLDFVITGPALIGWYAPAYSIVEAPFIFRNFDHLDKVLHGKIGEEIENAIQEKLNISFLSFFHRGPRYLTTTNRKIKHPEDLEGLKLRVPKLPVYIKSWRAFGANPSPLAYSDMYMALKQGVVEGQENPLEVIYTSNLYEAQNYVMETKHLVSFYIFIANDRIKTKLNNNELTIVKNAAKKAADYQNKLVDEYEEFYKKELKKNGVEFVEVNREAFKKLAKEKLPRAFKDVWKPGLLERISEVP